MKEEIHNLIKERWSPRVFKNIEISEEQMFLLFEAARWAPSSRNSQPWRFVSASKDDQVKWMKILDSLMVSNQEWAQHASHLVLVCAVKTDLSTGNMRRHAFYDLGLAVGNLTFQANSMGIFVRNIGGFDINKAIANFAIPNGIEPVVVLALGYPDDSASENPRFEVPLKMNRKREPVDKIVFDGSWDLLLW